MEPASAETSAAAILVLMKSLQSPPLKAPAASSAVTMPETAANSSIVAGLTHCAQPAAMNSGPIFACSMPALAASATALKQASMLASARAGVAGTNPRHSAASAAIA